MDPHERPSAKAVVTQLKEGLKQYGMFAESAAGGGGGAAAVSRPQYDMNTGRPGQSGAGYN